MVDIYALSSYRMETCTVEHGGTRWAIRSGAPVGVAEDEALRGGAAHVRGAGMEDAVLEEAGVPAPQRGLHLEPGHIAASETEAPNMLANLV